MSSVDLRPFDDDDADAVFAMMRDPASVAQAAFTADDPDDRVAFDGWLARHRADDRVSMFVVTENGGFAGTAAAFTVDGDREVTVWIAPHAQGRGVGTAALRLLVAREPIRPLFARVAADNAASIALLERNGFAEVERAPGFAPGRGREIEEVVFALVPAIDGV